MEYGPGIRVFNSLPAIQEFVSTLRHDYVAQKYIETPLLISGTAAFSLSRSFLLSISLSLSLRLFVSRLRGPPL